MADEVTICIATDSCHMLEHEIKRHNTFLQLLVESGNGNINKKI